MVDYCSNGLTQSLSSEALFCTLKGLWQLKLADDGIIKGKIESDLALICVWLPPKTIARFNKVLYGNLKVVYGNLTNTNDSEIHKIYLLKALE